MNLTHRQLWARFQNYYSNFPSLGLAVDLSRMFFPDDFFQSIQPRIDRAFAAMDALEHGAIANPDEKRMVGHYWLRNPALAPTPEIRGEIERTLQEIRSFASEVHSGRISGAGGPFRHLLVIGIGGSALGPQFVSRALGNPKVDRMAVHFFDNTDPDGMERTLNEIGSALDATLCVVLSKSGGTKETRNGMLEAQAAFTRAGLEFGGHAVAVTGPGSELDTYAIKGKWLRRFPMWDWVGGRTSEMSAVGLLPAALQGISIEPILEGAHACDETTRVNNVKVNPAAQLALAWFHSGNGKGIKDMVILPYKDRLELFSRYLQQLVMESLGKELDLDGKTVHQGLAVYGNKGSTDQHAYVQQLREGIHNFFVTFIEVLKDTDGPALFVEPDVTSGDYLNGFLLGTRAALSEKQRESITITVREVSGFSVGVLIALYERAVGLYASLIHVNAYHQPGVEAGKKAASSVIEMQREILQFLGTRGNGMATVEEIAAAIKVEDQQETVFKICEHLAANPTRGITKTSGPTPFTASYGKA